MATFRGTIIEWNDERGIGYIQREGTTIRDKLHFSQARAIARNLLRVGISVEYEMGSYQGQPQAENVRFQAAEIMETESTHFYNPYNFVRYLGRRPDRSDDPVDVTILGQCPPPPHDRWVGLTGQIDCRATVVTPLFIADAENVYPDENVPKHKHYEFFNINGEKKVPASSLRGMFRNIYEAVTNSRFGTFNKDKFPLEYRQASVPQGFMPARVCAVLKNGKIALEKMDCRKPGDGSNVMNAAWLIAYQPKVRFRRGQNLVSGIDKLTPQITSLSSSNERVAALVSNNPIDRGRFKYYEVQEGSIVPANQHHTLLAGPGWEKVFGYLHITGPNIERKHHERLFFRRGDHSQNDHNYASIKSQPYVELVDADVVAEYNQRLQEYYDRNQRDAAKPRRPNNWPLTSEFVRKNKRLKKGDLVYLIDQNGRKYLRPVSIPRLPYLNPRQALLPPEYHPASHEGELSPADRMFGWVQGSGAEGAYAGRIRFSMGDFVADKLMFIAEGIPLAILSTPKPTTIRFYLSDKSWQAQEREDAKAGYNNLTNRLRGRKMYRHFMPSQFKENNYKVSDEDKSDQNRSVHGVVDKTSEFTFSIQFENLHEVELGALLWTIVMEEGMYHRLGMAKPLGFGSLQVKVDNDVQGGKGVRLFDTAARYSSLEKNGLKPAFSVTEVEEVILRFKKAMVVRYLPARARQLEQSKADGESWSAAFATLDNVSDLMSLLRETPTNIPIHYPRLPGTTGENYQWFMKNKRPLDREGFRGEWLELEVPSKEIKGNGLIRNVTDRKRNR